MGHLPAEQTSSGEPNLMKVEQVRQVFECLQGRKSVSAKFVLQTQQLSLEVYLFPSVLHPRDSAIIRTSSISLAVLEVSLYGGICVVFDAS